MVQEKPRPTGAKAFALTARKLRWTQKPRALPWADSFLALQAVFVLYWALTPSLFSLPSREGYFFPLCGAAATPVAALKTLVAPVAQKRREKTSCCPLLLALGSAAFRATAGKEGGVRGGREENGPNLFLLYKFGQVLFASLPPRPTDTPPPRRRGLRWVSAPSPSGEGWGEANPLPFREGSGVGSKSKTLVFVLHFAHLFVILPKISCCYGFGILYSSVLVQVVQDWA